MITSTKKTRIQWESGFEVLDLVRQKEKSLSLPFFSLRRDLTIWISLKLLRSFIHIQKLIKPCAFLWNGRDLKGNGLQERKRYPRFLISGLIRKRSSGSSNQPIQLLLEFSASKISSCLDFKPCNWHLNRVFQVEYQVQNIPLNVSSLFFGITAHSVCFITTLLYIPSGKCAHIPQ